MSKFWENLNTRTFFVNAVLLAVIGHLLDFTSTVVATRLLQMSESNILLQNPITGGFLLGRALVATSIYLLCICGGAATGIKLTSKSWGLAAIPFLYDAYGVFYNAVSGNLWEIAKETLLFRIHF
jgi:hypothetical protein